MFLSTLNWTKLFLGNEHEPGSTPFHSGGNCRFMLWFSIIHQPSGFGVIVAGLCCRCRFWTAHQHAAVHVELQHRRKTHLYFTSKSCSGLFNMNSKFSIFLLTRPVSPLKTKESTENLTASFSCGMNLERLFLLSAIHLHRQERRTCQHGVI